MAPVDLLTTVAHTLALQPLCSCQRSQMRRYMCALLMRKYLACKSCMSGLASLDVQHLFALQSC